VGNRTANTSSRNSGSPECNATTDTVTISRAEYRQLRVAAESWWRWWAGDHLDDLVDQRFVSMSHAISRGVRWSGIGPRHQELARLRDQPAWVRRCRRPNCPRTQTVYSAQEWRETWHCADHQAVPCATT
jgi:hypothetical protein